MGSTSWFRQFQVLVTANRRLLLRRPVHLLVLLLSSVPSVILAWLAGRDARGPSGDFPPLTDCGMVDPYYIIQERTNSSQDYYYNEMPLSMNEAWRSGLAVWVMGLGPTFSGISAFLILRDELQSRRWGTLRAADLSAHLLSWLFAFGFLGVVNSFAGAIASAVLPNVHVFQSVSGLFPVFGTLLFLNLALVAASFLLAALCGTIQSLTLTVFLVIAILVVSSVPAMMPVAWVSADASLDEYGGHLTGGSGVFWLYGSTERLRTDYSYNAGPNDDAINTTETYTQCESPIVSYDQSRNFKTPDEQEEVPKEDIFQGCYVVAASSLTPTGASSFFWFLIPQYHFMAAWSNILGYTSLPGNTFTFAESTKSPEYLAQLALSNYNGGKGYDPSNTNGTSLFPQGSTIIMETYWGYEYGMAGPAPGTSNCPSSETVNLCVESETCVSPKKGYPSSGSPSLNDRIGLLASLVVIYSILAAYVIAVLPMENGAAMKFYFPFYLSCRQHKAEEQDGIEAINVRKSYGKVEALKPLSLTMRSSQVTALLGHNGAGKSTFVNLLCCEQNPTNGDIRVQGHSVASSDKYAVRKMIGECKQDDILWPNLTAREHLELFGGLRGVSKEDMAHTVQRWLDSVDLDLVQHTRVSSFSGGMKRRLSVALATIGNVKIVVLDEPTTGMDPVSRRFVWKHISDIKDGRVILLTTHAMEEADKLSDHVVILNHGTVAAIGSPLELKTKYGSALQFSLIYDKGDIESVEESVKNIFRDFLSFVEFESGSNGYSTLTIKKVCKEHGNRGPDGVVPDIGVPVAALSAFIGWLEDDSSPIQEFGISNSSLEEVFIAVTRSAPPCSTQHQTNTRGCCFCCRKRQPMSSAEVAITECTNALPIPSQNINHLPKINMPTYSRNLSVRKQIKAIFCFFFVRNWTGRPSIINWTTTVVFSALGMVNGFGMARTWPSWGAVFMLLVPVFLLSFMLISVISPIYSDRDTGMFKMLSTQGMLEPSFLLGIWLYSLVVQFVYSFVFLTLFFGSSIYRNASTCDDSNDYHTCHGFGNRPVAYPLGVLSGSFKGNDVSVYAHSAPGGYGMVLGIIVFFSVAFPGAVLSGAFLPGFKISLFGVTLLLLVACASPAILYMMNLFDYEFMGNCQDKLQGVLDSGSGITLDNARSDFVEWVGWQVTDPVALTLLCTPAYAAILPQMGLFQTLVLSLMSQVVISTEPEEFLDEFINQLTDGGAACSGAQCEFAYATQLYTKNIGFMFVGALLLSILGLVMATVFIYPPSAMIRAKHFACNLFNCRSRRGDIEEMQGFSEMEEVVTERNYVHSIMQPFVEKPADLEANESPTPLLSRTIESNRNKLPPIVMHKLRKVFPPLGGAPEKVALESLDLHVPKGEVLGLLGKNGAGKTTALNILAGIHRASSGIGLISGYDVETELNCVYERLGNCPQFDCVWKDQSVQRHLEFYARLKGIDDPNAAIDIAHAVGLGAPEVFTRQSGALSGGMRRRLSIAVSLLGSPNALLLDEPTTGLDPSTRNEIWSLLSSFATHERAIIITTHMMLEADTLCNRIAIVAKGALKVVGTQQHLKDNYGSGYLLQLNLANDNEQAIESLLTFVRETIHEKAKIVTKQARTLHINLPREVKLLKIFTSLYSERAASEAMINQFLVSQSSLEDVFVALGE